MIENFTITVPNFNIFRSLTKIIISLIISALIIVPILGYNSFEAIVSFIILYFIIYIIVISITSENLSNELPSTLYPSLPHTGLDGISLSSYVAGTKLKNY
jgi:hypothetical protein